MFEEIHIRGSTALLHTIIIIIIIRGTTYDVNAFITAK